MFPNSRAIAEEHPEQAAAGTSRPVAQLRRAEPARPDPGGRRRGVQREGLRRDVCVEDIIAAAGVSRRTFYEHFKNKEHAFLAAYDAVVVQLFGA